MTATARSDELRAIAQRIADALPATVEEAVVTGTVSRGVADVARTAASSPECARGSRCRSCASGALDPELLLRIARSRVTRSLTEEECRHYCSDLLQRSLDRSVALLEYRGLDGVSAPSQLGAVRRPLHGASRAATARRGD